jgi:hypothetical protein
MTELATPFGYEILGQQCLPSRSPAEDSERQHFGYRQEMDSGTAVPAPLWRPEPWHHSTTGQGAQAAALKAMKSPEPLRSSPEPHDETIIRDGRSSERSRAVLRPAAAAVGPCGSARRRARRSSSRLAAGAVDPPQNNHHEENRQQPREPNPWHYTLLTLLPPRRASVCFHFRTQHRSIPRQEVVERPADEGSEKR